MKYLLSEYFNSSDILKEGFFTDFGYANDIGMNMLTYADTIYYFEKALNNKDVSAIIIKKELLGFVPKESKIGIIIASQPRDIFFSIYEKLLNENLFIQNFMYGRGQNIKASPSSIISEQSYIGNNCEISDNVVIKDNVYIGDNCFVDAGAIIGSEGFLYRKSGENIHFIKHAGCVKISNNVTILSNAVIAKSIFPNVPTLIDSYSIIGIATTIGHESYIGKNCKILGNCVVAKNAKIGNNSFIGSSSVIRENIMIGRDANVKAGSIVVNSLCDNEVVSGNFAYDHNKQVKNFLRLKR